MAPSTYTYAATRFGNRPYAGLRPLVLIPSRDVVGIPFIAGNDRYQVIVCPDQGTACSAPKFRYWYAGTPLWDEDLVGDTHYPTFHSLDETGQPVVGELQLPPRVFEYRLRGRFAAYENLVQTVLVDFVPRPTALTESVDPQTKLGFTARVEGHGLSGYARDTGGGRTSGVAVSDSVTFESTVGAEASDTWPNIRSVTLPVRLDIRVRVIRVILTDIKLVRIMRVTVLGESSELRET